MSIFMFFLTCIFTLCLNATEREAALEEHIVRSIYNANLHVSKLNDDILNVRGMSSAKVRHFLNNLCSLPGGRYLEIGTWAGSTWVAALYGNENALADAVAIDDWVDNSWSAPGWAKNEFHTNCRTFLQTSKYRSYEEDCFKLDKKTIFSRPVNIYFYDGGHTEESQELALTYFDDVLDDLFILVVDDWNHPPAKIGTINALEKLHYTVLFSDELPARYNGDQELWWNGVYVALIKKTL